MADLTPEQREALAEILHRLVMTASRAMSPGKDADGTAMVVVGDERRALSEILALGWRAPGPPTEEEVERAARGIRAKENDPTSWESLPPLTRDGYCLVARAALTAVLGGKSDDND